jgi:regulator of protease activity HflC (stomatin/prohibitin superfamily)
MTSGTGIVVDLATNAKDEKKVLHAWEQDFTAIIGESIPFHDPVMRTDEFKKHATSNIEAKVPSSNDGESDALISPPSDQKPHPFQTVFLATIGDRIPFVDPNVHKDSDIVNAVNHNGGDTSDTCNWITAGLCALTCVCIPYLCQSQVLIEQDSYGFSDNNGKIELLLPGRHVLLSPLNRVLRTWKKNEDVIREGPVKIIRVKLGEFGFADDNAHPIVMLPGLHVYNDGKFTFDKFQRQDLEFIEHGPIKFLTVKSGHVRVCYIKGKVHVYPEGRYAINDSTFIVAESIDLFQRDVISVGPVSVIRVKLGEFGFADDNAQPVVLLPGLHVYNDSKWRFANFASQNADYIEHGPIKLFTVKSGTVRVCFQRGKVRIYPEGRYAVNDITFLVSDSISMQQQNVCFDKHPVLLDGGIKMLVEGLLTYQVIDAEKVVQKIGSSELLRSITNVSKAELSRVFATLHMEQISSSQGVRNPMVDPSTGNKALLGDEKREGEGESRSVICSHVVDHISPIVSEWGIRILNFQLESIKLADQAYSREYEEASLATAKAKANLRATNAQNDILISTAQAKANALKIEAEAKKQSIIIEAQALAEARKIEATARNEAAEAMKNLFGQQMALSGQQVEFAKALKANVLTVVPDSTVGRALSQNMLAPQEMKSR